MERRPGNETLNAFSKGMNMDLDKSMIDSSQYLYAENARIASSADSTMGAIAPIENPRLIKSNLLPGLDIVAMEPVRDMAIIFANSASAGSIHKATFSGNQNTNVSVEKIFESPHRFSSGINVVARYDADDNIKAYFSEPENPIRVISLTNPTNSSDIDDLGFTPEFNMSPPQIDSIVSGILKSGRIYYCYRLYSEGSTETLVSRISAGVDLFSSEISKSSMDILGSNQAPDGGLPTGKGVSMSIWGDFNRYNKIRIFSIQSFSSQSVPVIKLIADTSFINNNNGSFIFIDTGVGAIDEITRDEFDQIGLNLFTAKTIEAKDDILFAAGIKDININFEDYDVRAFAFNKNGLSRLYSANLSSNIAVSFSNLDVIEIPKDHDCINKDIYEKYKYSDVEYKYDADGNLGGQGKNVKYNFINTYLIESYGRYLSGGDANALYSITDHYKDQRIARIGDIRRNINEILIKSSDQGSMTSVNRFSRISVNEFGILPHQGHLNYANPLLSERLRSYQRDEIYRFGAVFYDKNGRRSDVKWIADIRFPANYVKDSKFNASSFEDLSESDDPDFVSATGLTVSGVRLDRQELLVKPMGLKFQFSNIPAGIEKIEIVRSKRDINNRTIISQGVVQKIGTKKNENRTSESLLESPNHGTLLPHPIIGMGYAYSVLGPHIVHPNTPGNYGNYSGYDLAPISNRSYTAEKSNKNNISRQYLNYTDHSLSPHFNNVEYNLFISPETCYYGFDYVESIRKTYSGLRAVVNDIIFPKSTPALTSETGWMAGAQGYAGHELTSRFVQRDPGLGGRLRPSCMYFAADITDESLASTPNQTIHTVGMVGSWKTSVQNLGNVTYSNTDIPNDSVCDMWDPRTSHEEPVPRAFVSIGGGFTYESILNVDGNATYNNGIIVGNKSLPRLMAPELIDHKRASASFKYFCSFNKKLSPDREIGGNSLTIYKHASRDLSLSVPTEIHSVSDIDPYAVSEIAYSGDIPSDIRIGEATPFYISIKGSLYLNYHRSLTRGDSMSITGSLPSQNYSGNGRTPTNIVNTKLNGVHGNGIVLAFDRENSMHSIGLMDISRRKYTFKNFINPQVPEYDGFKNLDTIGSSALATYLTVLKFMNPSIYGGRSYSERQFSEYISTGYIINRHRSSVPIISYVFGGDTYIGLLDYTIIQATDQHGDNSPTSINDGVYVNSDSITRKTGSIHALIPLESSINMRLASSRGYVTGKANAHIQPEPGSYNPFASYGYERRFNQTLPQYRYNSAYSAERTANMFLTNLDYDKGRRFDYRVVSSEKKSTDERFDSWSVFKPANYIDVDSKYGKISRLKLFNNSLFFLQENAFGSLSVNDRSLIQDNNIGQLVLGTGGVLQRFDYLSTNNGMEFNAVNSIISNPSGMYWYDHLRGELCSYKYDMTARGYSVGSLSKTHGVQSLFTKRSYDMPLNMPIGYDKKNNEVLFSLNGISNIKETITKQ